MSMTRYEGNTNYITNTGTTVEERGLETGQFKALFDKGLQEFITWFNSTFKTQFDLLETQTGAQSKADVVQTSLNTHATLKTHIGLNPACRVYNSTNQSIANNSWVSLSFNSERFDTDNMHSTSSNTSRITFNTAGIYLVIGLAEIEANANGNRTAVLNLNGGTSIGVSSQVGVSALAARLSVCSIYIIPTFLQGSN